MRRVVPSIGVFAAAALALAVLLQPGCEEVLEICPPCGSVAEGAVNVSGNPALDGTIEALQRVLDLAREAEADLGEGLAALAAQIGAAVPEDGRWGAADVAALVEELGPALLATPGATTVVTVEQGGCDVDTGLALARQIACERAAGCYVRDDCEATLGGSCRGLCTGDCGAECDGACYAAAEAAGAACLPSCVGACDGMDSAICPGRCLGTCAGTCSAHAADGQCAGFCLGACTGTCEHDSPFDCGGTCRGLCLATIMEGAACGHCRGNCSEGTCAGGCRGHFRVKGCDQPSRCAGVIACQETGRLLAWGHLSCAPAAAEVRVSYEAGFAGDRAAHAAVARALERLLARLARHRARLALLVDGVDVTGETGPEALAEDPLADPADHPEIEVLDYLSDDAALCGLCVVPSRRHLPLSALLARLGVLADTAGSGDFQITAGAMPCVTPAFEEAHGLLLELLPVTDPGLCASCAAGEDADPALLSPDRGGGLYRVIDAIEALFAGLGVAGIDG